MAFVKRAFLIVIGTILAARVAVAEPVAGAAGESRAEGIVRQVRTVAVELARADDQPRQAALRQQLAAVFDFATIAQGVLGRYWTSATQSERQAFEQALAALVVQGLVRRFGARGDAAFDIVGTDRLANHDIVVASKLAITDARLHLIDWRIRPGGSRSAVVDVVVDGRSMIATRREEFGAQLRSNGGSLASLTASLRNRASPR